MTVKITHKTEEVHLLNRLYDVHCNGLST